MSRLLKSSLGTFAARTGLSLVEFLGILYVATVAGATILGTYALFRAVFVIASLCTDLGTREASIKRIAEGDDRGAFLAASFLMKTALLLPILVGILSIRGPLEQYVGYSLTIPFLLGLAVLDVVVDTVYGALHGQQRVGRAELTLFANITGKVLLWIALLSLGYGMFGLLIGLFVGGLLQLIIGLHFLSIRPRVPSRRHFESLLRFSRYSWLGAVRERTWIWTDTFFLGFFVSTMFVGVYELTWQLSAAFFLVSSAISSTLFANVDRLLARDGIRAVTLALEASIVYAGIVVIPGLIGGIILAPSVLSLFGPNYALGSSVLVILIVARLFHCYEVIFAKTLKGLDRPDLVFKADTVFVILTVLGNLIGIAAIGWTGAAIATAFSMAIRTILSYHYLSSIVTIPVPRRELALEVAAAIVMGLVVRLLTHGQTLTPQETGVAIVGGAAVYTAVLLTGVGRIRLHVRTAMAGII